MFIIRPITQSDTEAFIKIAFTAGIGMTSMPKNRKILEQRIRDSEKAFAKSAAPYDNGTYLFVLEDLKTGEIGGTCGIAARTGVHSPISFYRIKDHEQHNALGLPNKSVPALHVYEYRNYWSEICSLYLSADFRHSGVARLLSLSRFLFIASFPERFHQMIFAEMRGHVDEKHHSVFWEGIGMHFVDTTYEALMQLRNEGLQDLSQVPPSYPIFIELLPKDVQESIGKVHENTQPALHMLLDEGFVPDGEIDICDGGPKIEAEVKNIRSVRESLVDTIAEINNEVGEETPFIVTNNRIDFRACLSPLRKLQNGGITIPAETAKALQVKIGDVVRYVAPHKDKGTGEKK